RSVGCASAIAYAGAVTPRPVVPDALRPSAADARAAWARRVRAEREQTDRARELADPADYYAPTSHRFRFDRDAGLDAVGRELAAEARPGETWLAAGGGGGPSPR